MIGWGHRTSKCVQVFKLGWGHCTGREQLGWGHRTTCKAEFQDFTTYPAGGWMAGWMDGWMGGPLLQEIIPLRGSILQVGTCQILSLAENPRLSQVWQIQRNDLHEISLIHCILECLKTNEPIFKKFCTRNVNTSSIWIPTPEAGSSCVFLANSLMSSTRQLFPGWHGFLSRVM